MSGNSEKPQQSIEIEEKVELTSEIDYDRAIRRLTDDFMMEDDDSVMFRALIRLFVIGVVFVPIIMGVSLLINLIAGLLGLL